MGPIDVKVGDSVTVIQHLPGVGMRPVRITKVSRMTSTQVLIPGFSADRPLRRFRIADGRPVGGHGVENRLVATTQDHRDYDDRCRLNGRLAGFANRDSLSLDQLRRIVAILDEEGKS